MLIVGYGEENGQEYWLLSFILFFYNSYNHFLSVFFYFFKADQKFMVKQKTKVDYNPKNLCFQNSKYKRGTSWGESGFGKLARNKNNHCGIGKKKQQLI